MLIFVVSKIRFLCALGLYVYDAGDGMNDTAGTVRSLQVFTCTSLSPAKVFQGYISE